MFGFFTSAAIQPNFDNVQKPQPSKVEISPARYSKDYKVATKLPPSIDFKRFLPKKEAPAIKAPEVESEDTEENNHDKPLAPKTTVESKKKVNNWLKKFLKINSTEIRKDIIDCNKVGGEMAVISSSGGDAEINCIAKNGQEVIIDTPGNSPKIVEALSNLGAEAKIGLKLVTNKYGKLVICYTQENFPTEKKVLFERDGFVLREEITYNEFFKNIQVEIIKNSSDITYDTMRCNLSDNVASLSIENYNGVSTITCLNADGTKDSINFENLNPGTKRMVQILKMSSDYGYNTKLVINPGPNYKFKIEPLYEN
jgi:hypothetical protein